jgi:hypothetical protein
VHDPKSRKQEMKQSLRQTKFSPYFPYFWKVCNKSQGTFVENVTKVQNQPTLQYSTGIIPSGIQKLTMGRVCVGVGGYLDGAYPAIGTLYNFHTKKS